MSYSARRDTGLLAFAGSALATELVMYCATKKTPEESTQELKLPAPGSQSPCLADVTNLKTIRKAPGRGKEKDKRAARRRGVGGVPSAGVPRSGLDCGPAREATAQHWRSPGRLTSLRAPRGALKATLETPGDRGHRLWGPPRSEAPALRCPPAPWDTLTDCKKRKVPT